MPAQEIPSVSPDELAGVIRDDRTGDPAALRTSPTRRSLLDSYATVLAEKNVVVSFEPRDGETARVELATDPPQIAVPSWEIDQPVTSVPRRAYDLLVQRTLTAHEVAHVNYTDNAAFAAAKSSLPPAERPAFQRLFNTLEDGAIEEQLRSAFDVADALAVTNANVRFMYDADSREYDLLAATTLAGLDLAVFDSGTLGRLLNPANGQSFTDAETRRRFVDSVLRPVAEAATDMLGEPDGAARVERVRELWVEIRDEFDSLEPPEPSTPKGSVPADSDGAAAGSVPADGLGAGQPTDAPADGLSPDGPAGRSSSGDDSETGGGSDSADGSETSGDSDQSDDSETGGENDSADGSETSGEGDQSDGNETDGENDPADGGATAESSSGDGADETAETGERTGDDGVSETNGDGSTDTGGGGGADGGFEPESPDDGPSADGSARSPGRAAEDRASNAQAEECDPGVDASDNEAVGEESSDSAADDATEPGERPSDENSGAAPGDQSHEEQNEDASEKTSEDADGEPNEDASEETNEHTGEELAERAREAAAEAMSQVSRQRDRDRELAEDYERAAERIEEAVAETDVDRIPMRRPPTGEWDGSDRWQEIRRDGERLGRIFDQRLQNERRSEPKRGRRRGRLDPRSLPRLARNDPRVFRSDDDPDEKEYAMILVLDRSGSMSKTIGVAERAVAVLAQALESVGVETCLVEMYRSSARIAVPFTVETAVVPEAVLTGETSGGTPLAEVLAIAREYVARTDGDPAMITVTDGKPSDEVAYREQLRQTPFPVLGVYVDPSARSHRRAAARHDDSAPFYDQRRIVVDPTGLSEALERLAREVMF